MNECLFDLFYCLFYFIDAEDSASLISTLCLMALSIWYKYYFFLFSFMFSFLWVGISAELYRLSVLPNAMYINEPLYLMSFMANTFDLV